MNFPVAADEIDDRIIDRVKVSFYTRPIGSGSSIAVPGDLGENYVKIYHEYTRHWAVSFYFPNSKRWITHEANLIDGKLVWVCTQLPPIMVPGCRLYKNIATIKTSPKRLQEIAKKIEINNMTYNLTFRNCQERIKLFAHNIGGELWHYLNSNFKTYFNYNPLIATIVGVAHSIINVKQVIANTGNEKCDDYIPLDIHNSLFEYEGFEDRIVDNVQVSFYTKPYHDTNRTSSDDSYNNRLTCDRRWVLIFYFPDSCQYITYEAILSNEKIVWVSTKMPPVKVNGGKLYKSIATCHLSPNQLRRWTNSIQNNSASVPYDFDCKNFQLWIKRLALKIGGDVWNHFYNIKGHV